MCGIAGIVGSQLEPGTVERMVARLRHRGPDDAGSWSGDGAQVGHARLSIVDPSPSGHQPMLLDDLVLVYNGETYNHRRLRSGLAGDFHSTSDSETILHLYREHGARCVELMTGMFAFAVWDRRRRRLFVARDRLGIKPLHYRIVGDSLAFASEIKALLELGTPAVDRSAIRDYFCCRHVPAPKTIYTGIRKLPPAHTLTWQDGRVLVERYWQPAISSELDDPAEAREGLDALLRTVIPEHLMSDVPVGVFLSGGLDSATITAYLDRPSTFTLCNDVPHRDEGPAARRVAEMYDTDHHEERVGAAELDTAVELMPPLFDEPFCDSGAWAFWAVSRMARRHVTVALSGEGADELFLGYPRHAKQTAPVLPAPLAAAARLAPTMSLTGRSLQRRSSSGFARYLNLYGAFTTAQQKALLHPAILDASNGDPAASFAAHWRDDLDPRKAMQWLDLNTSLHDWMLTKVDRTSMAHGLEVRPPFLDHRVVEFALTLHPDLLRPTGAGPGKQLLRSLMRPKLPPGHLDRPKSGFNLPIRRYVKRDPGLLDRALDRLADAKIIRRPRLAGYAGEQVWALLVLDRWLTSICQ